MSSRKRPGSDSFSRGQIDKRPRPDNPPDGSEKYISPKSPSQTGNYAVRSDMRPPDQLSNTRNGVHNGKASPKPPPSPKNANVTSTTVARSGSGGSTPQSRMIPFAPMGNTATPSNTGAMQTSGSIPEQLNEFLSSIKETVSAQWDLSLARQTNDLRTTHIESKWLEKNSWAKSEGEIGENLVKEKETKLKKALADQEMVSQAFASVLSMAVAPANNNLTSDLKQMLDQKDKEIRQLNTRTAKLEKELADIKAQNIESSSHRLKTADGLRLDYERLMERTYDLEEHTRGYAQHTKAVDQDVGKLFTRTKNLMDEVEDMSRHITSTAKDEVRRAVPVDLTSKIDATSSKLDATSSKIDAISAKIDAAKVEVTKDLRSTEADLKNQHAQFEQKLAQRDVQLSEMVKTVDTIKENLKADETLLANLSTNSTKLENRIDGFEKQISSFSNVPDQIKDLTDRLSDTEQLLSNATDGGQRSTTHDDANKDSQGFELYSLESHEYAIEALQKKVHSLDANRLLQSLGTLDEYKGNVEEANRKIVAMQQELEKTEAKIEKGESRISSLEKVNAEDRIGSLENVNAENRISSLENANAEHRISSLENVIRPIQENQEITERKLLDLYKRQTPQPLQTTSPSPHIQNANLSAQNGVIPQPSSPSINELQKNYATSSQHIRTLSIRLQDMESLKSKVEKLEGATEAVSAGLQDLDSRYNNLTTDEMVQKMVHTGLPVWQNAFPAAVHFQAEAEKTRREIHGIKTMFNGMQQTLLEKSAKIENSEKKVEQTANEVGVIRASITAFADDTRKNHAELKAEVEAGVITTDERDDLKSAITRLKAAERDLGTIEQKLSAVEAKADVRLDRDQMAKLQHAVEIINSRSNRPVKLPSWDTELDHSILPR